MAVPCILIISFFQNRNMQTGRFTYLFHKYISLTASQAEREEFILLAGQPEYHDLLRDLSEQFDVPENQAPEISKEASQHILQVIFELQKDEDQRNVDTDAGADRRIPFLRSWWAAAALVLALATGAYFWKSNKTNTGSAAITARAVDIAPGKDGATLTLADGTQVVLDSLGNGVIANQNGTQVLLKDGELAYNSTGERPLETAYNTITTSKGRQFSLLLPDGTRVWLNAASSVRYPTAFSGKARQIEMTGEAYFEVAKDIKRPFLVNVNNAAEVEVSGTHFNVNAYENENTINTTLLEGRVKVNATLIRPGQQAQVGNKTQPAIKVINNVDIDKVMAWRNGLFNFNGLTFEEIMRQLERWYDIKVVYENNVVPDKRLAGEMTRGVSLNELLKQLGEMGVRYKLDDRTLIILP